jgi:tetratricopeptide (TPR) repeat protein
MNYVIRARIVETLTILQNALRIGVAVLLITNFRLEPFSEIQSQAAGFNFLAEPSSSAFTGAISASGEEKSLTAEEWHQQGLTQQRKRQFAAAAESFEAAARLDPTRVRSLMYAARAYVASQQLEAALNAANRAIAIDSTQAEAYLIRGRVLQLAGELSAATASYEKSIALAKIKPVRD